METRFKITVENFKGYEENADDFLDAVSLEMTKRNIQSATFIKAEPFKKDQFIASIFVHGVPRTIELAIELLRQENTIIEITYVRHEVRPTEFEPYRNGAVIEFLDKEFFLSNTEAEFICSYPSVGVFNYYYDTFGETLRLHLEEITRETVANLPDFEVNIEKLKEQLDNEKPI